jgi:RNA polymerase sigma-70 factor, ECF subfamily
MASGTQTEGAHSRDAISADPIRKGRQREPLPSRPDEQLWPDDLGRACLEFKPMVMRAIRRVAPSLEAEDVYQYACLQAVRSQDRFRREAKFSTWFVTVAINCAYSQCRAAVSQARTPHLFRSLEEILDLESHTANPEEQLLRKERESRILREIEKLSQPCRNAVFAKYYWDMSIEEISALLGASKTAIKSRLFKARLGLQSALG